MIEEHLEEDTPSRLAVDVASGLIRMKLRETILVAERVSYIMETHPSRLVNLTLAAAEGSAARELGAALNAWDIAMRRAVEAGFEAHAAVSRLTSEAARPKLVRRPSRHP